jgi:hypothetical protein
MTMIPMPKANYMYIQNRHNGIAILMVAHYGCNASHYQGTVQINKSSNEVEEFN